MDIVSLDSIWSPFISAEWLSALDATPFLSRCRSGTVTRSELNAYLLQHGLYSRHFTRYLSALLANICNDEDRRALVQNLFEEMGCGTVGSVPHSQMYRDMVRGFGLSLEAEALFPETEALVATMFDCCNSRRPMVGLGALCLGAEAIVPRMYSVVLNGFEALGESLDKLEFFRIHIQNDEEHAITMRGVIARELMREPDGAIDLEYGATRAITARIQFFKALTSRSVVHATQPRASSATTSP